MAEENLDPIKAAPSQNIWGPIATILWAVLIAVAFLVTQTVTAVFYFVSVGVGVITSSSLKIARGLQFDGLFLSIATFATTLVCCSLLVAIIKLKRGSNLKAYVGLILPKKRELLRWLLIVIIFWGVTDLTLLLLGKPIVTDFMAKTYTSMKSPWILWIALILAAPFFEELFFRGFLIKGLSASPLRWYGAVILSSLAWAAIHLQYDVTGVIITFLLGVILGVARVKSDSTLLTIFLHSFVNLCATGEVIVHLR